MDTTIKAIMLTIVIIWTIKMIERIAFSRKRFTCKYCGGKKAYDEMYTIDGCKKCIYGE